MISQRFLAMRSLARKINRTFGNSNQVKVLLSDEEVAECINMDTLETSRSFDDFLRYQFGLEHLDSDFEPETKQLTYIADEVFSKDP